MLIDAHVHLAQLPLSKFDSLVHEQIRDELLAVMDENKVDAAVVYTRRHRGPTSTPAVDERLLALAKPASGMRQRLFVVATVNPLRATAEDYVVLGQALATRRVVGIKLYLGYQHFYPTDLCCGPVYQLAQTYNVPVVFHTGDVFVSRGDERLKYAHPLAVDEVAMDYPRVRFVMAHLGNPWMVDCAAVLAKCKNTYADLSGLFVDHGSKISDTLRYRCALKRQIEDLVAYAGADRLIYGSDWPLVRMDSYHHFVTRLDLPSRDHERIFSRNAIDLFGLPL